MDFKKNSFMSVLVVVFLFLFDGQLSTLLTNLSPGFSSIAVHLVFIYALHRINRNSFQFLFVTYIFLGLLYDIYYFNFVGFATSLFPVIILLIYFFNRNVYFEGIARLLTLLVVLFLFEVVGFLIARLFNMTNLSIFIFVFYNLLPSLLCNLLLFFLTFPIFENSKYDIEM
ncbi:TPA: rod shape-determining protein MreD [Streptococcus suis]|nr:rod shape-determining protein MreD [Streptococcus suis]